MAEPRDPWSKFEIIAGAVGALGSIAIPVTLFVASSQITARQRDDADHQLQADRVERMLGHLVSNNPDEKRLAVRVVEFFIAQNELPGELLPALAEIARSAEGEELSNSASQVLEKAANNSAAPALAKVARQELSALPARLDVHAPAGDGAKSEQALAALVHEDIVVRSQPKGSQQPKQSELRYYRPEDANQARQVAATLADKGVHVQLKDLSSTSNASAVRPRKYDLMLAE